MVPGIDTGGGGISNQTASSAQSGNNGNTNQSSADRVSKQFITVGGTGGAAGLDMGSFLGAANADFYRAIMGEQQAETAQFEAANRDRWLPYAGLGVVALLGLGFIITKGRK